MIDYTVRPTSELDGYYIGYQVWTRDLDEETLATGVICQAWDQDDFEVGKLAIDAAGTILIVEVLPEHRRRGIATKMLAALRAAGYTVEHDWQNVRDDGAAWARSADA
jgi:GNAT superfamily N-acetyltransferase